MRKRWFRAVVCCLFVGCVAAEDGGGGPDGEPRGPDGDGDNTDSPTGNNGDGTENPTGAPTPLEDGLDTNAIAGNLRLYLTDAPVDLDEVWVAVTRVEIGAGAGGDVTWMTLTEEPMTLDLLTLQHGMTAVLGDANLEPGEYQQIRFILEEAWVVSAGEELGLTIPSGTRTGIKINLDFTIEPDAVYAVVLDFDAAESIFQTGGGELKMAPVIKVAYIGIVGDDGVTPIVDNTGDGDGDDEGVEDDDGEDDEGDDADDDHHEGDNGEDDEGDGEDDEGDGDHDDYHEGDNGEDDEGDGDHDDHEGSGAGNGNHGGRDDAGGPTDA